ncbi:MAG: phosphatidate cytidylyltransferase, partial [Bacteroidetes bacterium]|nr:phosphatidate cytidylyltransferase [Bacteroidota bacterium]
MLTGLLWNHWSFLVLFSVIHFGCWWEYLHLLEKIHRTFFHRYIRMGFMLTGFAIMLWFCAPVYRINNYSIKENFSFPVSIAGAVLLVAGVMLVKRISLKAFVTAALGLLYLSLSWGLFIDIYSGDIHYDVISNSYDNDGFWIYLWIIAMIWINDTMAYIVGSLIGKTPLSRVSPKKTWEGTGGGILLCMAVSGIVAYLSDRFHPITKHIIIIAAITSITGTFGDLLESKLKRMAGVKDSGHIMPGHGGFLDRFDSLLLAVPAVWLYIYLFMR